MTRSAVDATTHSVPDSDGSAKVNNAVEKEADEKETGKTTDEQLRGDSSEEGAISAEYAVATVAAVAFASLLIAVVSSPEIREALLQIIRGALSI